MYLNITQNHMLCHAAIEPVPVMACFSQQLDTIAAAMHAACWMLHMSILVHSCVIASDHFAPHQAASLLKSCALYNCCLASGLRTAVEMWKVGASSNCLAAQFDQALDAVQCSCESTASSVSSGSGSSVQHTRRASVSLAGSACLARSITVSACCCTLSASMFSWCCQHSPASRR
jgi:hypothetical protein